jgi:hypothetical protein
MNTSSLILRSAHFRARLTTIALSIYLALAITVLLLGFLFLVSDPAATDSVIDPDGQSSLPLMSEGFALLLKLFVFILTAVLFLCWVFRASQCTGIWSGRHQQFSPGWAVGWFFIPFANLVMPLRVMKEIWNRSDPELDDTGQSFIRDASAPGLLQAWWIIWVITNLISRAESLVEDKAHPSLNNIGMQKFLVVLSAFEIVSTCLAIMVVRGVDQRQRERAERLPVIDEAPPAPPVFA